MSAPGESDADRLAEEVRARLRETLALEMVVAESIGRWGDVVRDRRDVAEAFERIQGAARSQSAAVEARLEALGGDPARPIRARTSTATQPSTSAALRGVASLAVEVALAYEAAYQTARLGYDYDTCDLAAAHLGAYATAMANIRRLLPHVIAWELRKAGLTCTCRCPMCSIGACGCVRATLVTVEEAWGGQHPREDGLALLVPPRPGSQLAEAGLHEGDRILSVDGTAVGSNPEIQDALRRHEIGELVRLLVERRTGERLELAVSRIA